DFFFVFLWRINHHRVSMTEQERETARGILTRYLQEGNHRKTPERYAILDAAYRISGLFSMEELGVQLEMQKGLVVSRATLYNTVKLLVELGLLVKHHTKAHVMYAAVQKKKGHCQQICTVCGKVRDLNLPEMTALFSELKVNRFRKENFILQIYGVCHTCQLHLAKQMERKNNNKQ
ncbi:MAG: Fur family transcriptional regulator, partial [Prevotella sp.]